MVVIYWLVIVPDHPFCIVLIRNHKTRYLSCSNEGDRSINMQPFLTSCITDDKVQWMNAFAKVTRETSITNDSNSTRKLSRKPSWRGMSIYQLVQTHPRTVDSKISGFMDKLDLFKHFNSNEGSNTNSLSSSKDNNSLEIGTPYNFRHRIHVDVDLNWNQDPTEIFELMEKLGEG